jgi:hypothetical protein
VKTRQDDVTQAGDADGDAGTDEDEEFLVRHEPTVSS